MDKAEFQEFWDNLKRQHAHERRTPNLHGYAAGQTLSDADREALVELGWLTDDGLTDAGRAWLTDQGLHLEITDTALFRRLRPGYCADKIMAHRIQAPVAYAGRLWVNTGGYFDGSQAELHTDEVVTPEVFVGQYPDEPVRGRKEPYWGPHGYCGCHVAYQGQVYVLTERTLKVRPASGDSAQPPTPPQQLALFA